MQKVAFIEGEKCLALADARTNRETRRHLTHHRLHARRHIGTVKCTRGPVAAHRALDLKRTKRQHLDALRRCGLGISSCVWLCSNQRRDHATPRGNQHKAHDDSKRDCVKRKPRRYARWVSRERIVHRGVLRKVLCSVCLSAVPDEQSQMSVTDGRSPMGVTNGGHAATPHQHCRC